MQQAISITYHDRSASEIAREISACETIRDILICEKWVEYLKLRGKIPEEGMVRVEAVLRRTKRYLQTKTVAYQ